MIEKFQTNYLKTPQTSHHNILDFKEKYSFRFAKLKLNKL